ncbi:ribosomal protein S5 domain 2-like protein [Aureobasidium sp. EXF-10728]|nr:ribosomal protein S5 domain 2-like protein [Aureobasidium sp. EXF-10728]
MAKRPRSPSPRKDASDDLDHDFWVSEAIEDRTSFFKAFFSPTMPAKELQNLDQIKDASHRILAWRSPSSQRTLVGNVRTLETGTDDDGERYGGRHVLKVIEEMRVEGALVVARWYGGIMLGPARFAHIENSARDAIRAWRQNEDSEGQKRRRVEDEDMEKASLIVELADRDQNILVLRRLLEEKTKQALSTTEQKAPSRPPVPAPDYSTMPLERLRQFDKARDSTVAFLLKKIDEAERQNGPKSTSPSPKPSQPVQTRSETEELDNAATEDLVSKNEPVITKEQSPKTASNAEKDSASEPKSVKLASLNPFEEESSDDDDDS